MNKIIITAEQTCDLTPELQDKYNVRVIPMSTWVNDIEYNVSNPMSSKEFYKAMRENAKTSTSQVNAFEAKEFFESILKEGYDIVHVSFSKALSGTYNSCVSASEELKGEYGERIKIVDSLSAAGGQGLACILTSEYNDGSKTLQEVADYSKSICDTTSQIFIVDSLKYLARSGRVSKVTAKLGTILQIKPVLHVDNEGKLTALQKVISRKKSIVTLAEKIISTKNNFSNNVIIGHADCEDDAKILINLIQEQIKINPILVPIGNIIGSHSGPGTLAVFYTSNERI